MSRASGAPGQAKNDDPGEGTEPADGAPLTDSVTNANDTSASGADDSNATRGGSAQDPMAGLASMPDVQPHAIEAAAETAKAAEGAETTAGAAPGGFDPALHEVNADGTPRLNKDGTFRRKRGRGAKSYGGGGSGFKTGAAAPPPGAKPQESAAEREAKIQSTATVVAQMIFVGGRAIGGAEWEPVVDKAKGVDEVANMRNAWAEYFRIRGIMDVPPEVMIAVALGGYAIPRFFQPQTKSRVQKAKEAFYGWVAKRRARRGYRDSTPIDANIVP